MPAAAQAVLQHADDPGRPLVVDRLNVQLRGELGIGCRGGHRHGTGMRRVREQGAKQDHQLDAEVGERADQLIAEGTPAHVGLDPVHQHHITPAPSGLARDSRVVGQTSRSVRPSQTSITGRVTWKS
jgi:hypothetical protein